MNGANLWHLNNDLNSTALLGSVVDYLKTNHLPETVINQVYQEVIYFLLLSQKTSLPILANANISKFP